MTLPKHCVACGEENKPSASFCYACGARISHDSKPKRRIPAGWAIVAGAVAVASLLVVVILVSTDQSTQPIPSAEPSSMEVPPLSDLAPETVVFLSGEGAALVAFHDIIAPLAAGDLIQADCEFLVTDQLPAIVDTPAALERLAQTVPDEGGRDLFVNEVFAAFDAIGACTSGSNTEEPRLALHHSAVTAWLEELRL